MEKAHAVLDSSWRSNSESLGIDCAEIASNNGSCTNGSVAHAQTEFDKS